MRYRFALGLLLALAGCSDSGSDNGSTVPVLPWGSFRHDALNTSLGTGILRNLGVVSLLVNERTLNGFPTPDPNREVSASTPAIDNNGRIYIGTQNGVASFDPDGTLRWRATECAPVEGGPTLTVGRVTSSPSVTPGNVIVFGSDPVDGSPGAVFAFKQNSRDEIVCLWAFRPEGAPADFAVRSSPVTQVDSIDLSLQTVIVGGSTGQLLAINGDGTPRWAYPSTPGPGDVSSSPALTAGGVAYATMPFGTVVSIDFSGRQVWQANIGRPRELLLQPSPSVLTTTYATGASSALFGINPDGSLKWRYLPQSELSGSLGFLSLSFDQGSDSVFDTVVYTVTVDGQITGVRDANGMAVQPQRCAPQPPGRTAPVSCRMDSCAVAGLGRCNPETGRCTISNIECTGDSCNAFDTMSQDFQCLAITEPIYLSDSGPTPISTSLALSADQFIVAGTEDGQLCARALDGNVPGEADEPDNPWLDGCVTLGAGMPMPTRSSPAIGRQGTIFVTTDEGLFIVQ